MSKVQFGLVVPNGPYKSLSREEFTAAVDKSLELVTGHFDSAWVTDHLQVEDNSLFEGWTALTYRAAQHPQLKFGHAVLSQSFRNPALLAKMAATLQYLTNGRFILGIGAGWKEDEYTAYGYEFPSAGRRVGELEESLQIINALWREKQATVEGKYYRVVNGLCAPTEEAVKALNVDHLTTDRAFVGTPSQVIEQMRAFIDLGVDYFMFSCGGFPHLTTLEMLINEVLPALED